MMWAQIELQDNKCDHITWSWRSLGVWYLWEEGVGDGYVTWAKRTDDMQMTNDRFDGCWMVPECERRPKRIISEELNIIRQANTSSKNVWCATIFSIYFFTSEHTTTHTLLRLQFLVLWLSVLCVLRFAFITPRNCRVVVRTVSS